jgi:hypothetical protein
MEKGRMKVKTEEYEAMMTEEEREAMTRQQYLHQLDMLRTVNTFLLMGYGKDIKGIYEGMRALHYICSEDQIDFYCEFIGTHKGETIQEINDALWRFLWETEPPEIPEEKEPEKPKQNKKKSIEEYAVWVVFNNLLIDRIAYLKSLMKGGYTFGEGWKEHWVNCGYDPYYIQTLRGIIEDNPNATTREQAQEAYRILYQEKPHEPPYLYTCDRIDIEAVMRASRERTREILGKKMEEDWADE